MTQTYSPQYLPCKNPECSKYTPKGVNYCCTPCTNNHSRAERGEKSRDYPHNWHCGVVQKRAQEKLAEQVEQ